MEFLETVKQVVALVGFDGEGRQTIVSICLPNEVQKTAQVIFESWPTTDIIGQYEVTLKAREQAHFTRETIR